MWDSDWYYNPKVILKNFEKLFEIYKTSKHSVFFERESCGL